jgi:hypothetical protein
MSGLFNRILDLVVEIITNFVITWRTNYTVIALLDMNNVRGIYLCFDALASPKNDVIPKHMHNGKCVKT